MATLFRRARVICPYQRTFSTSSTRTVSLQWEKNDPEALAEVLPAYPYGPTRWYKQSRLGLYGGQRIQFGNNVSGPFDKKTRRTWRPNILTRKLFSKALNRNVQVRVSARVLRTIDKLGGLDEYLLGEKPARVKELGESGWWLRWAIMQTDAVKKRFTEERIRLGLPPRTEELDVETPFELLSEEMALEEGEEAVLSSSEEEAALSPAEEEADLTSAEEDMEAVEMDDAFEIEQTADLPPLKFRVGPGQHIMLTPHGWRRTRPDPQYFIKKYKQQLQERHFPRWLDDKLKSFERKLDGRAKDENLVLDETERAMLIKASKKALKLQLQKLVDNRYEEHMRIKNGRKEERRLQKIGRQAAKEAAIDAPMSLV